MQVNQLLSCSKLHEAKGLKAFFMRATGLRALFASKRRRQRELERQKMCVAPILTTKDQYGRSPLHLACVRGYEKVVKLMLEWGADTHSEDDTVWGKFTPWHRAACGGHISVLRVL